MVKTKFLNSDKKVYKFTIENTEPAFLNYLRRTMGYRIPIYAVDEIDFFENDGTVIDEMLANRIALVPIKTPVINTGKKVTLTLEKTGHGVVYSKDFVSSDEDIEPVYDTIPLTKLNEGERIKLHAFVTLGIGHDHVKYTPAIVSYFQLQNLELGRGCDSCKKCVEVCPKKCIEMHSGKPVLKNAEVCDGCLACVDVCSKNCLNLKGTNDYVFTIELIGQASMKDLLQLLNRYTKEYISVIKKKLK